MYYTYMIRCEDNSLYTGYTSDIQKRLEQHIAGKGAKYTRSHHPKQLAYLEIFLEKSAALKREAAIKKMTKEQKEALCHSNYEMIPPIIDNIQLQEVMGIRDQAIGHALVEWYHTHQRDLPWRRSKNPYSIWISEIMSQQTRIAAVIPYYNKFLFKFPTVYELAQARQEEVLKQWEGLGYYSRARNLHQAAIQIVDQYNGQLPNTVEELKKLSGVGDYTAAAIASIAFNEPVVAVDGNVLRVYSRIEASYEDISRQATKNYIAQTIQTWIPSHYASDFTQSMMDLGATICMPTQVLCEQCPVEQFCKAKQQDIALTLPIKLNTVKKKNIQRAILLVRDENGRWLLRKRTEKLLQDLWEFPGWDVSRKTALSYLKKQTKELGIDIKNWTEVGKATHVFTHITWEMEGFFGIAANTEEYIEGYEWVSHEQFTEKTWPVALQYYQTWANHYEANKEQP